MKAQGATWLDRQLVAKKPIALSEGGFGAEVHEAINARIDHHVEEGLARRQSQRVIFARDLLQARTGSRRGAARSGDRPCLPAGVWWRACRRDLPPAGNPRLGTFRHDRQRARLQLCPLVSIVGARTRETGFGHIHIRRQCRLEFLAQSGTRDLRLRRLPER